MASGRNLAALAVMLGACSGEPVLPPLGPVTVEAGALRGAERDLPLMHWAAAGPVRAVLLGLHGFGDFADGAYAEAGPVWAARGIEVYAYDQRGFGGNPDHKVWPGAEALIGDLAAALEAVRAAHPGVPVFVAGHSMGGGVVLAAAGEGRLGTVAGLVLLAPATWGGDLLPVLYRATAWTAAQVMPDKRWTGRGVVVIRPTDNLPMLRALSADPRHFATPSSREFLGLIRLMDRAVLAAPKVTAPALVVWGAHDEVMPEAPVKAAHDALAGPKDYARVPTGWHLLLRDLQAARVHDLVAGWLLSRVEAGK